MDMNRKLYRSNTNRMICGVCGGIGEYLNIDPTLVRLIWALVACSGAGVVAYLLAAVIIPQDPGSNSAPESEKRICRAAAEKRIKTV